MGDILYFPGCEPKQDEPSEPGGLPEPDDQVDAAASTEVPPHLRKALGIIGSGMAFVIVGLKPTDSGCDFYTDVVGPDDVIRPAAPYLAEKLNRALGRAGYQT